MRNAKIPSETCLMKILQWKAIYPTMNERISKGSEIKKFDLGLNNTFSLSRSVDKWDSTGSGVGLFCS
jgi:hypothetical protein